ncbi:MAG: DUF2510 domain-containing protein [Acidimicrobiales bacterium]
MTLTDDQHVIDQTDAGWFPDPERRHQLRYYDGAAWTPHVTHHGPTPCAGCFSHHVR